jgi:hypothetical protein
VTNTLFYRRSFQSIYHGTAISRKDMVRWGAAADECVAQAFRQARSGLEQHMTFRLRVVLLLIPEERGLQVQPMEESSASDPLSAQRILSWRTITAVLRHVVQNHI